MQKGGGERWKANMQKRPRETFRIPVKSRTALTRMRVQLKEEIFEALKKTDKSFSIKKVNHRIADILWKKRDARRRT